MSFKKKISLSVDLSLNTNSNSGSEQVTTEGGGSGDENDEEGDSGDDDNTDTTDEGVEEDNISPGIPPIGWDNLFNLGFRKAYSQYLKINPQIQASATCVTIVLFHKKCDVFSGIISDRYAWIILPIH